MATRAEWEGSESFLRFLRNAEAKYGRTERLMQRLAGYLESSTVRRIKEGNLEAENASVTKAVKEGSKPLQDRGQFQQGITSRSTKSVAAVGSNAKQAAILQTGGKIKAQSAEKLAFPAGKQTRALQRRYGFDFEDLVTGMREDGYDVWFMANAVMANKPKTDGDPFVLLIRKDVIEIPAYRPFQLTDEDRSEMRGIVGAWLREVRPKSD